MGNVEKTYSTRQYQFTLKANTSTGKKVSELDTKALADLFPGYDPESLQRKTNRVGVLLGCDHFGSFPKYEEANWRKIEHNERRSWGLLTRYSS